MLWKLCELILGKEMIRTYSELCTLTTFEDRFRYLMLSGKVGEETFGFDRYLNQKFYRDEQWKQIRNYVIVRDEGCDLGLKGYEIERGIIVHHMNPISIEDIVNSTDRLMNPEYLICTRLKTHNAIHYGDESILREVSVIKRTKNDTCPWKR